MDGAAHSCPKVLSPMLFFVFFTQTSSSSYVNRVILAVIGVMTTGMSNRVILPVPLLLLSSQVLLGRMTDIGPHMNLMNLNGTGTALRI